MRIFYSITGFKDTLIKQLIFKQLITNDDTPVSHSGLPSISAHLEWLPYLFVSGGLADLKLSPFE